MLNNYSSVIFFLHKSQMKRVKSLLRTHSCMFNFLKMKQKAVSRKLDYYQQDSVVTLAFFLYLEFSISYHTKFTIVNFPLFNNQTITIKL